MHAYLCVFQDSLPLQAKMLQKAVQVPVKVREIISLIWIRSLYSQNLQEIQCVITYMRVIMLLTNTEGKTFLLCLRRCFQNRAAASKQASHNCTHVKQIVQQLLSLNHMQPALRVQLIEFLNLRNLVSGYVKHITSAQRKISTFCVSLVMVIFSPGKTAEETSHDLPSPRRRQEFQVQELTDTFQQTCTGCVFMCCTEDLGSCCRVVK